MNTRTFLRAWIALGLISWAVLFPARWGRATAQAAVPHATPPGALTVNPTPRTQGEAFGSAAMLDDTTLVVGAPAANVGDHEQQGAAYIFEQVAGEWQQVKRIVADDGAAFDGFGFAVAVHGDIIVVSAVYAEVTPGVTNQGVAYVFARNQGGSNNWGQVKKLAGSLGDQLDNFGMALAVRGDDIFVAAPNQKNGMVYHYQRNAGGANNWGEVQQLFDTAGRQNDNFGTSLAFDGTTLVVGSARTDITELYSNDGAAFLYAFDVGADAWQEVGKLQASDASDNDNFGRRVAIRDDLIVIGAPFADNDADTPSAGKVYVFTRTNDHWDETAILKPSTAVQATYFGEAFVITADGILIYAAQGNGVLYAFQTVAADASAVNDTQTTWDEIARYEAEVDFFQSGYGSVLSAGNGQIAVGAPRYDLSKGGVYLYQQADVFTALPETKPSFAYMPLLANQPTVLQITGQLVAGGKVFGPDGVGIAAPSGSLTAPVNVALLRASAPAFAHDEQIKPIGEHYTIGAEVVASAPMTRPFLLAFPVPANVNTAQLAVAALISNETIQDAPEGEEFAWLYYEGEYDAANQRFVTTWPTLAIDGITFVLVEDPSVGGATTHKATTASPGAIQFNVTCRGFYGDESACSVDTRLNVENLLSQIHERMTSAGGFGYDEPRLRNLAENLDFDNTSLSSLGYSAYIERSSSRQCSGDAGYFEIETGRLVLCLDPGEAIDDTAVATLIHEYFHATEFAYTQVYQDYQGRRDEQWVIEGMAAAAEESYYLDNNLRRSDDFGIHDVDIPFDSEESTDEYRAQDFWIYVGQQMSGAGVNLSYFDLILRYGANISAVDDGLQQHFNTNFKDQLWDWASNQIIEKENNLDDALGDACVLEADALQKGIQYPWNLLPNPQTSYWPLGGGDATVPPYTTMVVQLIFPNNSDAEGVHLVYPGCEGNTDFDAWVQCNTNAQQRLPAQMYAEGLPGCFDDNQGRLLDPALNSTTFKGIQRTRRYFAVVTNVTDSDQSFKLVAELTSGP